jgi:hypothetical protein
MRLPQLGNQQPTQIEVSEQTATVVHNEGH